MEVNTGRAGFAFIRIRNRECADKAVAALHHQEYQPKYKMNVSIGKPPAEYKREKIERKAKKNKIKQEKKNLRKRQALAARLERGQHGSRNGDDYNRQDSIE